MVHEALSRAAIPAWNGLIYVGIGIVFVVAGYKMFRGLRKAYGMMLGAMAGLCIYNHPETMYRIAGGVVGGVCGLVLSDVVYYFGLFMTGGLAAGLAVALPLMRNGTAEGTALDISTAVAFLSGAVMALLIEATAMIVLTSVLGSLMCVVGFQALRTKELGPMPPFPVVAFAIVALVGIVIQSVLYRRETRAKVLRTERAETH